LDARIEVIAATRGYVIEELTRGHRARIANPAARLPKRFTTSMRIFAD
jgi:hypothetical protein